MKRFLFITAIFTIISVFAFTIYKVGSNDPEINKGIAQVDGIEVPPFGMKDKKEKRQSAHAYKEWLTQMKANQITGKVDIADVLKAREEAYKLSALTKSTRSALGLVWEEMGPDNIGGRTRAIMFDRNNPNRMLAGGVSGGLWISDNGGESWRNYDKNDTLAGIGVVSFAQAANGDIYLGTGEYIIQQSASGTTGGGDNVMLGEGMWKSTDGGNTFVHLPSTRPSTDNSTVDWSYVKHLAAHPTDPNIIYAGTHRGLKKTTDGGQTWTSISPPAAVVINDIAIDPDGMLHVSASGKYYRSESLNDLDKLVAGTTLGNYPSTVTTRLKIDIAPSDRNYIYIIGCNGAGQTNLLIRSTDRGVTWSSLTNAVLPSTLFNPTGDQGWYDMEIAANPADKERVYVGGQLNMWEWTPASGWYPITTGDFQSFLNPKAVHVDHHKILFHPNNPDWMYVGTDGGIYRTKNARVNYPDIPTWQMLNKNYNTVQFYSVSAGIDGSVMGGTQDNRTIYMNFKGNTLMTGAGVIISGDGGFSDIAKTNPNALFFATQFGHLRRSSNGGLSNSAYFDLRIDTDQDGEPDCGAQFVTPFRLWEEMAKDSLNLKYYQNLTTNDTVYPHLILDNDTFFVVQKAPGTSNKDTIYRKDLRRTHFGEGRMYVATDCALWLATDALNFGTTPTWFRISNAINNASYIEPSPQGDVVYVGTRNGRVYRVDGLRKADLRYIDVNNTPTVPLDDVFNVDSVGIKITLIGTFNGRYVTSVAVDKKNPNHVVVALGNYGNTDYVFRTTSASTDSFGVGSVGNFKSIQGSGATKLPALPVYSAVIDYYNPNNVIVGTELGVYATQNAGGTNAQWTVENTGKTFTPNFMMRQEMIDNINKECYVLYIGTHGRGIWRSTTLTPSTCNTQVPILGVENPNKDVKSNTVEIYPNPVNYEATISIKAAKAGNAYLQIYDIMGRKVKEKYLGFLSTGTEHFKINVSDLPNGNYIFTIQTDEGIVGKKIIVTK